MLLALVLAGCTPCAGVVSDPAGLAPDAHANMAATLADWLAAVGPDRVCVDRLSVVADLEPDDWAVVDGVGSYAVDLGAAAASSSHAVRKGLCQALDIEEGLSARLPDPGLDALDTFVCLCDTVPPELPFVEQHIQACGDDGLDADTVFLATEVYREVQREAGVLDTTEGVPLIVEGASTIVAAGGALWATVPIADSLDVVEVDPASGATTYVESFATGVGDTEVVGGDGVAVLTCSWEPDIRCMVSLVGEGLLATFAADDLLSALTVASDAVWLQASNTHRLYRVDRADGSVTEVPRPAEYLVPRWAVATAAGLYVTFTYGYSGGADDYVSAVWADGAWEIVPDGEELIPVGALDGGVVGATVVFPVVARVAGDAWAVSDTLCATDPPELVAGDVAWNMAQVDGGLRLTPYTLSY